MRLCACFAVLLVIAGSPNSAFAADKKDKGQQPPINLPDLSKPLTLDQAIRIGLAYQNQLGIARSQLDASRARVVQAQSSYYPQIAPTFNYTSQLTSGTVNGQRFTGTVEQSVTRIG